MSPEADIVEERPAVDNLFSGLLILSLPEKTENHSHNLLLPENSSKRLFSHQYHHNILVTTLYITHSSRGRPIACCGFGVVLSDQIVFWCS